VGYAEAADKDSFLAGVGVGVSKAFQELNAKLISAHLATEQMRQSHTEAHNDLKTLADIIAKYSSKDD
jgi:hypothetical protein